MIYLSLLLGIILRIYKISSQYYFTGELGKELLFVRQFILNGDIPLVGLSTSHEWLNYGPLYYWILIPIVKIFGWSPYILFWLALAVSVIGIYLVYFVFKNIVNEKFAVILAFLISVSPLWIWATRISKLHTFFFILTPLFIYFLYKIWNKKIKFIFWLGIIFGLFYSFHYSQTPLFIVILFVFWIVKRSLKVGDYFKFIFGLILPNITMLIYDGILGFTMIKNFVLWIPYRIAGVVGIYPKNNIDVTGIANTFKSFNEFFGRNLFWDSRFWILSSIIFILLFTAFLIENRKKFTKDFFSFYLILSTLVQCSALLIHTNPPLHYFYPIFLNFGLLFAYYTSRFWDEKFTKILTVLIIVLIFISGFVGLNSEHKNNSDYIPFATQERVANDIVKDSNGRPFSLVRLGPYDYFPEMYDQNYQFLILDKGGKIDQNAKLRYIIYDIGSVYVQKIE